MQGSLVLSLLFTIVFLATSLGRAQGSDRPEYKFNALGSPDFSDEKTKTKLKVSNSKDLSKVDPVRMLKNSQPYTGYVNYPRYQIGATFAPTRSGFKQEYYDLPMNFSVTSYESLMVNARYLVNPNFYADLEYSHSSFGVLGQTAGTYQVNQSTANVETILGRFIYCSIGSHAMNKLCYGGIAGWDAYPSLEFLSSASLGISAISDMVLGVSIGYEHVVAPFTSFTSTFEYLYGLCQGQSTALGVDSDSKIRAEVGLNFQNANNLNFYSLGIGYSYREARVHGAIGGYVDNWSTHTSAFAFLMKHTWTWGK